MVKDRQDAKKLAVARNAAQRDKFSQIAGMIPDEEYIAMLSAVACPTPSTRQEGICSNFATETMEKRDKKNQANRVEVGEDGNESKPLSKAERRLLKKNVKNSTDNIRNDEKREAISAEKPHTAANNDCSTVSDSVDVEQLEPTIHLLSSNSALSPISATIVSDDRDDTRDFESCLSGTDCSSAVRSPCSAICCGDLAECAAEYPQWYSDAVAALGWEASSEVRSEGYSEYLFEQGHRNRHDPIVNPYIQSEHSWWESVRRKSMDELNAKLAKEMRLIKTGTEEHMGTKASAKTKENRKIEKFTLATTNRFAGLANIR